MPPPVAIEQLVVDGVAQVDPSRDFAAGSCRSSIRRTASWRRNAFDSAIVWTGDIERWTDAQGRRELTFVDLPPGNYRFRVSACNLDDVCNEAGAVAPFVGDAVLLPDRSGSSSCSPPSRGA